MKPRTSGTPWWRCVVNRPPGALPSPRPEPRISGDLWYQRFLEVPGLVGAAGSETRYPYETEDLWDPLATRVQRGRPHTREISPEIRSSGGSSEADSSHLVPTGGTWDAEANTIPRLFERRQPWAHSSTTPNQNTNRHSK